MKPIFIIGGVLTAAWLYYKYSSKNTAPSQVLDSIKNAVEGQIHAIDPVAAGQMVTQSIQRLQGALPPPTTPRPVDATAFININAAAAVTTTPAQANSVVSAVQAAVAQNPHAVDPAVAGQAISLAIQQAQAAQASAPSSSWGYSTYSAGGRPPVVAIPVAPVAIPVPKLAVPIYQQPSYFSSRQYYKT